MTEAHRASTEARDLDDAQEAFDIICEGGQSRIRKTVKDLIYRLNLNLSKEIVRDIEREMEKNDGRGKNIDFDKFEAWWKKYTGSGGARAVKSARGGGGPLRDYFVQMRKKLKKNHHLHESDEDDPLIRLEEKGGRS